MFRLILFALALIIFCLLGLFVWLAMWIIHFFNQPLSDRIAFFCIHNLCRLGMVVAGVKLDARGLENLKSDRPAVYIMNHRGIFDIIIAYALFDRPTGFIAKKELSKIPFLSRWILLNHGLFLDRNDIRAGLKTILTGIDYIKEGFSMAIFPEGTRNKDKESHTSMLPFHAGSFKLSERTDAPIIPIVFHNTESCYELHKPFIKSAPVKVLAGAPIIVEGMNKDQKRALPQQVQDTMQEMLNSLEA